VLTCGHRYFHAYRIDHILGFFRIWEIPSGCVTGLLGHFRPSLPLWRHELEGKGVWDFDRWAGQAGGHINRGRGLASQKLHSYCRCLSEKRKDKESSWAYRWVD
jgi:hypothetical protein